MQKRNVVTQDHFEILDYRFHKGLGSALDI